MSEQAQAPTAAPAPRKTIIQTLTGGSSATR